MTTLEQDRPAVDLPHPVASTSHRTSGWWVRPDRPTWALPAHIGVTLLAAVLYTWNLSSNGMGNDFYAAAVKAGTESWKAFLFGSLDPGNFITVDKPPASLWVMELSGRIFGFSSWSMLLPEALAGVITVAVLYHLVRRWAGEVAAVLAGLAMALTPIAVVMFRDNNPDALLTLILVLSAWGLWAALESGRTSRLVLCGALLGLAFNTKMLQAFVVVPVFSLVYLVVGQPRLLRRLIQLLWGGLALLISSSWWVAIVELWPAASRPYIGSSTNNSELDLIFGYNGFGRFLGSGSGTPGGFGSIGGGSLGTGGHAGWLRMFNDLVGGQVSWLLPFAVVGLVAGLWHTRRRPRRDLCRAGYLLWGGWMLCTAAVFSDTKGIFNAYYTVALAPAVTAVAGAGAVALWRLGRDNRWLCFALPAALAGSAAWAGVLLRRSPGYAPGLATGILVAGIVASVGLLCLLAGRPSSTAGRWLGAGAATIGSLALLAGPLAYSVTSIQQGTSGPLALAGPAVVGGLSPIPGMTISAASIRQSSKAASHPSSALVRYLKAHRHGAQYLVAVSGSLTAAPYIISTGQPVMAMGGYTGMDPWPTLTVFKTMVAQRRIHYVLVGSALSSLGFGGKSFRITPAFLHEIAGFIAELKKHPRALAANLFGSNNSGPNAVDQWTRTHGVAIPPGAYGGSPGDDLYYVSPLSTKL